MAFFLLLVHSSLFSLFSTFCSIFSWCRSSFIFYLLRRLNKYWYSHSLIYFWEDVLWCRNFYLWWPNQIGSLLLGLFYVLFTAFAGVDITFLCISFSIHSFFFSFGFYFIVLLFGLSCPSGWPVYLYIGLTFPTAFSLGRNCWVSAPVTCSFLLVVFHSFTGYFGIFSWALLSSYFNFFSLLSQFILGLFFTVFHWVFLHSFAGHD